MTDRTFHRIGIVLFWFGLAAVIANFASFLAGVKEHHWLQASLNLGVAVFCAFSVQGLRMTLRDGQ